jgi:hypothetical protein
LLLPATAAATGAPSDDTPVQIALVPIALGSGLAAIFGGKTSSASE